MFWIRGVSWAQPMPAFLALLGISLSAPALLLAETLVDGCGHIVTYEESGTLASKNYPGTYPNYTQCEITIQVPAGKNLYMKLADLDIESKECESAYLKIYKGSSLLEHAFCGGLNGAPKEIFLDTNVATIRFESGLHVSGRGFLLNYASSDHPDLITCLARSNHYEETEYSRYCPAGCRDIAGDVSGDVVEGYRDTSLLCKAAIHAGVIADELGGQIHLIQHKGASRYQGVLANGIVSKDGCLSHEPETGSNAAFTPSLRSASAFVGDPNRLTRFARAHNSSTHPMWEKTNVRVGQTPMKEEKTITEPVPSEETDLGWKIIAIIVPLVLFVCLLVAAICIFITRSYLYCTRETKTPVVHDCNSCPIHALSLDMKRLKAEAYGSADEQKSGCWKQLEQPFVRQQSAEFAISYNNEKDTLKKFDLITCDMEDFQQSLMIGTGTVTRKGSTFKPMDTEAKDTLGTQEIENHYDCPHRSNRHEYALPLTNPEPEYATPIIERHLMRENTFTSEAGYNIPVVSLDRQKSFSAVSFSISSSPEHSGGDYQTPQCINKEEGDYDRPKVHSSWAAMENGDYQKPHICSLVTDGYSSPRDCLKPINQTAITAPL
ncbi:discoidin, CUB and LCCL domain-containing protein 1 [Ascaphus truei]|uniref:discoidin, CUB and LCCL domain-containing protein 1 n=1 Tax=Ascaphus truei TaxID=8439 RepID=UPI003F595979